MLLNRVLKRNLHSILVKSIHILIVCIFFTRIIYIPFWLNLYLYSHMSYLQLIDLHSILVKSIPRLPISKPLSQTNLHSILVKSILIVLKICRGVIDIYIPFWLNLYPYNHRTLISAAKTPPFCRPRYYTYLVYQINLINTDPISILTK